MTFCIARHMGFSYHMQTYYSWNRCVSFRESMLWLLQLSRGPFCDTFGNWLPAWWYLPSSMESWTGQLGKRWPLLFFRHHGQLSFHQENQPLEDRLSGRLTMSDYLSWLDQDQGSCSTFFIWMEIGWVLLFYSGKRTRSFNHCQILWRMSL